MQHESGPALDGWGAFLGMPREVGEPDQFYRQRIAAELTKPRKFTEYHETSARLPRLTRAFRFWSAAHRFAVRWRIVELEIVARHRLEAIR